MRLEDVRDLRGRAPTAISCPFCMQMFDEARRRATDPEGSIRVADIAELVAEALEEEA